MLYINIYLLCRRREYFIPNFSDLSPGPSTNLSGLALGICASILHTNLGKQSTTVMPGTKNQMIGTHIGFEINMIKFIDNHVEFVLDCSYTYSLPFFVKF